MAHEKIENRLPIVGVAAIIIKDGKVLFGKRKGKHGAGTWAPPGGKLEFNEEFDEGVRREVLEETGLNVKVGKLAAVTNNLFKEEAVHSITLFFMCEIESGEVEITEPDKVEKWGWFGWEKLPSPLFISVQRLLEQNFDPFKQ